MLPGLPFQRNNLLLFGWSPLPGDTSDDRCILHHQLTECTTLKEPRQIFNHWGAIINCQGTIFDHWGAFQPYLEADVKNAPKMQDLLGHNI